MDLDTYLDHGTDEVKQAIVQFAARRSYRLRQPWYLEGLRIEMPPGQSSGDRRGRVDIELKRKRGKTRLRITVGRGSESAKLAYELQSYLQDDRAYHAQCPPMCPKCGRPVPNIHARYCGRCGRKLVTGNVEEPRPVAVQARAAPPPVPIPAPNVIAKPQPETQQSPTTVERDVEAAQVEAISVYEGEEMGVVEIVSSDADLLAPGSGLVDMTTEDLGHGAVIMPAITEAEEDSIDPPNESAVEAEEESDLPDEDRPRQALAED